MQRYVLCLGSNLGSRLHNIFKALAFLTRYMKVLRVSGVYLTEPVGPPQGWFLNVSVLVLFDGNPPELLDLCKKAEVALGRVQRYRWGPREIDVDIIWWEGSVYESDVLVLPHVRWHERRFVVRTLKDLGFERVNGFCLEELERTLRGQVVIPVASAKVFLEFFLDSLK